MRILLVHPPNTESLLVPTAIADKEYGLQAPLGLIAIASYIESLKLAEVRICDCQLKDVSTATVIEEAIQWPADLIGIYVTSWTLRETLNLARKIKSLGTDIPIVAGGPHCGLYPDEMIRWPEIDYVVSGEGEVPFADLIRTLRDGHGVCGSPGISYKQNGLVTVNAGNPSEIDLDRLPIPDYRKVPFRRYSSILSSGKGLISLESSRGCPFRCVFCYNGKRSYRAASAEWVIECIRRISAMNASEIYFVDDTFNIDKSRLSAICRGILDHKLKISWTFRGRPEGLDRDTCHALRAAGCRRIQIGVESGSERVLANTGKQLDLETARKAFSSCRAEGIKTVAYFLLGLPGETESDIEQTIEQSRALDPDYALFGTTILLPDTDMYREACTKGHVSGDPWREHAENPMRDFSLPVYQGAVPFGRLLQYRARAHKKFFWRFKVIRRHLAEIRSLKDILWLAGGMHVLLNTSLRKNTFWITQP